MKPPASVAYVVSFVVATAAQLGWSLADVVPCEAVCRCQVISPSQITVHCARRSLPQIPWRIPTNVTYLDVSYNRIGALDGAAINDFRKLKTLDLRNNLVSRIDSWVFQKLSALEELDLDNNLIRTITPYMFSAASNLKILSLANNAISAIENSAFIHLSLDSLNLRDNRKLSSLDPGTFADSGVNTLILDGCGISNISDGRLLRPISDTLRVLSLSNMLSGLRIHTNALTSLDLDILQLVGNDMTPERLAFLAGELRIRTLDLSLNKLPRLDLAALKSLRKTVSLIVKRSHVRQIVFSGDADDADGAETNLAQIRELDLSGNALTSFPVPLFRWLPALQNLNVADNPISRIDPAGEAFLDRLQSLDISNVSMSCGCDLLWFADWRNVTKTAVIGDLCVHGSATGCTAPYALTAWIQNGPDDGGDSHDVVDIFCRARGNPSPQISLIRQIKSKHPDPDTVLLAVSNGGQLRFRINSNRCCGYRCTAVNRVGNDTIAFYVCPSRHEMDVSSEWNGDSTIRNRIEVWILTIVMSVLLILVLLALCIVMIVRRHCRGGLPTRRRRRRNASQNSDDVTNGSHMTLMKYSREDDEVLNTGELP